MEAPPPHGAYPEGSGDRQHLALEASNTALQATLHDVGGRPIGAACQRRRWVLPGALGPLRPATRRGVHRLPRQGRAQEPLRPLRSSAHGSTAEAVRKAMDHFPTHAGGCGPHASPSNGNSRARESSKPTGKRLWSNAWSNRVCAEQSGALTPSLPHLAPAPGAGWRSC
jgi:hypothetical protein